MRKDTRVMVEKCKHVLSLLLLSNKSKHPMAFFFYFPINLIFNQKSSRLYLFFLHPNSSMNLSLSFHNPLSQTLIPPISASLNPKKLASNHKNSHHNPPNLKITTKSLPPTDTIIDFGKHKGKMIGTLPSTYLKWISQNLRAGDTEHWAKLADDVLQDPVYQDRIEWEFAEAILQGHGRTINRAAIDDKAGEGSVPKLVEISERFGWDNDDKMGWSKVKLELLGTSKGGRIPRVLDDAAERERGGGLRGGGRREKGVTGKRRERRERVLRKKEINRVGGSSSSSVYEANYDDDGGDEDHLRLRNGGIGTSSPFPGREAFLKKVLKNSVPRGI